MRNEKIITLNDRGNKLTFKIREMSATDTGKWIMRALKALGAAGAELPDGADLKAAVIFIRNNFQSFCKNIDLEDVQSLLDDLLRSCTRVVGKAEESVTPETIDDYVSDVRTLFALYGEAAKVCLDFFGTENRSESPRSPKIELHK